MQRDQLDVVVLARELLLQLTKALLERDKLALEDVRLVHLIGHDHQLLLSGNVDHLLDVLGSQGGASWVARVDDHKGAHLDAGRLGVCDRLADHADIRAPGLLLIQVVRDALRVQKRQGRSVQWVLRNRHQNTSIGAVTNHAEQGADTG